MNQRLSSENISCIVIIGLATSGRKAWQEEEETRKDTSIVLIRQEQFFTSGLRLITKIGGKALPHLGGTGKIPGGILHLSITATMDPALIDRGNLLNGDWANYSWNDSQH